MFYPDVLLKKDDKAYSLTSKMQIPSLEEGKVNLRKDCVVLSLPVMIAFLILINK